MNEHSFKNSAVAPAVGSVPSDMFDLAVSEGIATVTLDRAPANAMNSQWVAGFHQMLDELGERDDWNVLHIRSGLRLFSAGADIKEMRSAFNGEGDVAQLVAAVHEYQDLFFRIEALPQITLAEINGDAMGGGFELALSCDLRIVADEARVGLPEVRIGLLPGAGGTQRLTRLCGRAVAFRIINGTEMVDGKTAVELGMAQWHAPLSELMVTARDLARHFARQPARASRLAKQCINLALGPMTREGFDLEYAGSKELLMSEDSAIRIRNFLAQRSARGS